MSSEQSLPARGPEAREDRRAVSTSGRTHSFSISLGVLCFVGTFPFSS